MVAYVECKRGTKEAYLREHGISRSEMDRWHAAMADGDLENDVVPRLVGRMTREDVAELKRVKAENARLAREVERLQKELDRARGDVERYAGVADVLGKAIGAIQARNGEGSGGAGSN